MRNQRGFTLLEVLVATAIAGIAIAGLIGSISNTANNAHKLTDRDRATLLAKSKMDELLVDPRLLRNVPLEGTFDPASTGGFEGGWRAVVTPFETAPGAGPGMWVVDRVELQIWWTSGGTRHTFELEGFRRAFLNKGDT